MSEQVITQAHLTIVDTNDIESIVMEYARNQSTSTPPDPNTGGWSTTRPDWAQNYYIWQRTRIHKTGTSSNEDTFGTAVCLTGSAGTNSYTHVRYAIDSSGTGMTATPSNSTTYIGIYNGTSSTAPTAASLYTWSKYVGENGNAVSRIQSIYYRTNTALSNSITGPTTWITVNTNQFNTTAPSTAVNGWSTKITPSAASADSNEKYLYLYTCTQTQSIGQAMNNGTTCVASTILLDETTTVIDGGNIITGTVHANAINASSGTFDILNIPDLNASKITAGDIAADRITTNLISAINAEVSDISALEATVGGFQIDDTSIHTRQIGVTSNADNSIALSSTDFTRTINNISRSGLRFAMGDKFAVTGDGTIYASNVNLTGNITATSGTIGGCSINNGVLQVGNANVSNITVGESQVTGLTGDLADAEANATDYITDIDSKAGITIHKAGDSALSSRYLKLNASGVYNYYDSNNRTEMLSTGFKIYKNNILRADYADAIKLYDSTGIQKLTLDTTNGVIVGEINKERIQINNTGTVIYDYDNDRTTNKSVKRTQIDKDGLHIYNTDGTTETGLFGAATARIGTTGGAAFHINDSSLQAYYVNGNTRTLYFQVSPTGMSYGPSLDNVVATTSDIPTTVAELTDSNDYLTTIIANNTYATQTSLTAETNRRKAVYGTAPATIAGSTVNGIATTMKTIVCDNFEEYIGARITIKFTNGNTATAPTLKIVNISGTQLFEAKAIWNANTVASVDNPVLWGANATITFVYDGNVWIVENKPSSYSVSCDTSADNQIKRPVLNNIAQPVGAIILNGTTVTVNFSIANTYTNTNNHTAVQLNLSDTGAADIYKNGIVTSYSNQLLWNANTELTFVRKGQYWYLVSRSDASETAENFITEIGTTGIMIHPSGQTGDYNLIDSNGMEIFNNRNSVAKFKSDGAQIGESNKTHINFNENSFKLVDNSNVPYFYMSGFFGEDGYTTITMSFTSEEAFSYGWTSHEINFFQENLREYQCQLISLIADNEDITNESNMSFDIGEGASCWWIDMPNNITTDNINQISLIYKTKRENVEFTFGNRSKGLIGNYSTTFGKNNTASGNYSHAEGYNTEASSSYSHAGGYNTIASGYCSHAEGNNTIADSNAQTVLGKYNIEDSLGTFAVIIGNGDFSNRRNALTVDWNGIVNCANIGSFYQATGASGTISTTAGTITPITLVTTDAVSNGSGFSISNGGIKVANAGKYRVTASIYILGSNATFKGIYVKKNNNSTGGTGELMGLHYPYTASGVQVGPKVVSLEANDVLYLCGRMGGVAGTIYTNNTQTYLLVERIA